MPDYTLITAIGTPLKPDESLHIGGLEAQIDDQFAGGITGLLVGGTMGAMQLLSDETYEALIDESIRIARGRGEVLIGVGDTSLARTLARVKLLNTRKADGAVVLSPYMLRFSQTELIDYYTALADASMHPLYLYDLPVITGTKLEFETVRTLSRHRNIRGIKCSGEIGWTRQLIDLNLPDFRVIVAAADMIDVLFRSGVTEHLDGIFAAAPHWVGEIAQSAMRQDWASAAAAQQKINALLRLVREFGVFATFTAILNARGIPGNYAPRPYRALDPRRLEAVLASDPVRLLLDGDRAPSPRPSAMAAR